MTQQTVLGVLTSLWIFFFLPLGEESFSNIDYSIMELSEKIMIETLIKIKTEF